MAFDFDKVFPGDAYELAFENKEERDYVIDFMFEHKVIREVDIKHIDLKHDRITHIYLEQRSEDGYYKEINFNTKGFGTGAYEYMFIPVYPVKELLLKLQGIDVKIPPRLQALQ